jgi:hypothetical protein
MEMIEMEWNQAAWNKKGLLYMHLLTVSFAVYDKHYP